MGERYPGKCVKAGRIGNIDPGECVEYRNVVLVCGTNDLRPENSPNIPKLVDLMISKASHICTLNPKASVFLMPVLPTRNLNMNRNIMTFNRAIFHWVEQKQYSITMPNVSSFLDNRSLLASPLTRGGDSIHLGTRGLCKFVTLIKDEIYRNFNFLRQQNRAQKTRRVVTGRPPV